MIKSLSLMAATGKIREAPKIINQLTLTRHLIYTKNFTHVNSFSIHKSDKIIYYPNWDTFES